MGCRNECEGWDNPVAGVNRLLEAKPKEWYGVSSKIN